MVTFSEHSAHHHDRGAQNRNAEIIINADGRHFGNGSGKTAETPGQQGYRKIMRQNVAGDNAGAQKSDAPLQSFIKDWCFSILKTEKFAEHIPKDYNPQRLQTTMP